jgi:hypothetical protein
MINLILLSIKKSVFICVLNLRYLREPFFPLINAENIFKKKTDPFSLIFAETYKFDFIEHKKICVYLRFKSALSAGTFFPADQRRKYFQKKN